MTIGLPAPVMGMGDVVTGGMVMGEKAGGGMGMGASALKEKVMVEKEANGMGMGEMAMTEMVEKRSERYLRNV